MGQPPIDQPLAETRGSTTSYYELDGLGSVTSLSNSSGALANTYAYDSFGNLTAATGTLVNPFQYAARSWDVETKLYDNRTRFYDPTVGRFTSEDPIGFKGGTNFYAYVFNNPISATDPSGEVTQLALGGPVWDNPWGHVALIIDGEVFSYGTNYTGGLAGVRDWGRNAADYLSAQADLRETDLLTLGISADQEAKLLDLLKNNNPYSQAYDLLAHSCVRALLDPLRSAGIIPIRPGPGVETPQGTLQAGAPAAITPNGLANLVRSQNLVTSTTAVGSPSIDTLWRAVYALVNGFTPD